MKKLFIVLVAVILVASFATAQDFWGKGKMSAGGGVELALPMSDWGDMVGMGIGGFGLFQYGLTPEILLTGQIGYTSWAEKEVGSYKYSASAFQIIVGGKYKFNNGFYGMLQIGSYSLSQKATSPSYTYYGYTYGGETTLTSSEMVLLPGVGYQMGNFDFSVKYTLKGNFNNFCLNAAYVVPIQ